MSIDAEQVEREETLKALVKSNGMQIKFSSDLVEDDHSLIGMTK